VFAHLRQSAWLLVALLSLTQLAAAQAPEGSGGAPAEELSCPPGAFCERSPWEAAGDGSAAPPTWTLDPGSPTTSNSTTAPGPGPRAHQEHRDDTPHSPYPLSTKPDRLPYEPGDPIPPGYRREKISHSGLLLAGLGVFGVGYLPWLAIGLLSLESDDPSLAYVAIPLVGPPLLALQYDLSSEVTTLLVVNGAAQGVGIALMVAAELAGDNVLIRDAQLHRGLRVAPWAGPGTLGAQLYGAF